ncbi:MAG: hypothetical protein RR388_07085, partial [Rikenellaceae bacterium]
DADQSMAVLNPFVQEHIIFVIAIRRGDKLNDTIDIANSTLMAIMGRDAAYTGKTITTEEALASDVKIGPKVIAMGAVPEFNETIPVAGTPSSAE